MTDVNFAIKRLLLMVIDAQTQLTAVRFALEDASILTPSQKASAMGRAQEIWGPRRKAVADLVTTDESLLEFLLKSPEGPIQ